MISKICECCDKEFFVYNYRKETAKFCSKKCHNISLIGVPLNIDPTIKPTAWNKGLLGYRAKDKNNKWKGGKPKCIDCGCELGSYRAKRCVNCNKLWQRGANIYNYKGCEKQDRCDYNYKKWRMDVFKKDWFTCQNKECNYKGKYIEAHHIKNWKDNIELRYDVDNGITLCKKCHFAIHSKKLKTKI